MRHLDAPRAGPSRPGGATERTIMLKKTTLLLLVLALAAPACDPGPGPAPDHDTDNGDTEGDETDSGGASEGSTGGGDPPGCAPQDGSDLPPDGGPGDVLCPGA